MHFFEADSVVVQHLHTKFFYLAWNCYVCCYVYNGWQAWYKTQARRTANTHRLFTSFLPLKKNLGEYDRSFLEVLAQDTTITTMHYWLAHLHENCTHPLFSSCHYFHLGSFFPSSCSSSTSPEFWPRSILLLSSLRLSSYSCAFSSWWVQQKSYM